ncbi:MAG: hypothetical protein HoeaKO_05070 [Hoeflea alexandrii]
MSARNRRAPPRGPAAYGRGGTEATTTDANLWLGRINKDYFCGGSVDADMEAAHSAIRAVGEKLGVDADEAARGIVRIANNNMVNALKLVSLNRVSIRAISRLSPSVAVARCTRGAGPGTGREEGRRPCRRGGVLGLGHDDVGSTP